MVDEDIRIGALLLDPEQYVNGGAAGVGCPQNNLL
jgi:hypothetical protein